MTRWRNASIRTHPSRTAIERSRCAPAALGWCLSAALFPGFTIQSYCRVAACPVLVRLPESAVSPIKPRFLFVEEMTKAVLEAESRGEAQRVAAAVSHPTLAVPASLHASLMARLDRLGPAKEVAQIAAVIGREFSHV